MMIGCSNVCRHCDKCDQLRWALTMVYEGQTQHSVYDKLAQMTQSGPRGSVDAVAKLPAWQAMTSADDLSDILVRMIRSDGLRATRSKIDSSDGASWVVQVSDNLSILYRIVVSKGTLVGVRALLTTLWNATAVVVLESFATVVKTA